MPVQQQNTSSLPSMEDFEIRRNLGNPHRALQKSSDFAVCAPWAERAPQVMGLRTMPAGCESTVTHAGMRV